MYCSYMRTVLCLFNKYQPYHLIIYYYYNYYYDDKYIYVTVWSVINKDKQRKLNSIISLCTKISIYVCIVFVINISVYIL